MLTLRLSRDRIFGVDKAGETLEGLLTEKEVREFNENNPAWRDQVWTKAAIHFIKKHRPTLRLCHLLNLGSIH